MNMRTSCEKQNDGCDFSRMKLSPGLFEQNLLNKFPSLYQGTTWVRMMNMLALVYPYSFFKGFDLRLTVKRRQRYTLLYHSSHVL